MLIAYRCSNCGRVELKLNDGTNNPPPYCTSAHTFSALPKEGTRFPATEWERIGAVALQPLTAESDAASG